MHFGAKVRELASVLDGDESELLLLADKVPEPIRQRIRERPEFFRAIAELDDSAIDDIYAGLLKADL